MLQFEYDAVHLSIFRIRFTIVDVDHGRRDDDSVDVVDSIDYAHRSELSEKTRHKIKEHVEPYLSIIYVRIVLKSICLERIGSHRVLLSKRSSLVSMSAWLDCRCSGSKAL